MATVITAGAATLTKTATPFKADKKGMPKAAIVAKANEHNFPTGEYKSLGKGLYTDDMLLPAFGYEPMTWEVEIQQSTEDPNFYRVISPYGKAFADAMLATNNVQLTESQYDSAGTTKLDIDASDPNNVYFAKTMIGLDWNYGPVYIGIPSSKQVTFKDGIFTAPVRGVAYGDNDGAVAMNTNQKWRIVLPGVEAVDYSMVFSFENQCTSNRKVLGKLTMGNDIDKVKYVILPNFQEDEVMGALADVAKKGLDLPVRGDFSWTMSEANKETIILVGLNRAGQQVAYQWAHATTWTTTTPHGPTAARQRSTWASSKHSSKWMTSPSKSPCNAMFRIRASYASPARLKIANITAPTNIIAACSITSPSTHLTTDASTSKKAPSALTTATASSV